MDSSSSINGGMTRTEQIREILTQRFAPSRLLITDDSVKHAGHAAMKGLGADETHFTIEIAAAAFAGKSRVEKHRMVNDALKPLFGAGLHALAIRAEGE
jgi:BolA protein